MNPQTIAHYVNSASAANARGDYAAAARFCNKTLQLAPDLPEAWFNLGVAQRGLGRRAEALQAQAQAAARTLDSPDAQNSIGLQFLELEAHGDAERCLRRAIALAPNYAFAYSNLAKLMHILGRLEEGIQFLREAIRIQGDFAPFHSNLGAILNLKRQFAAAENPLRTALALDPGMSEAWNNLGNALRGQKRLNEAEAAFRRAIELDPKLLDAYSNLGDVLRSRMRYFEASQTYAALYARARDFDFIKGRLLFTRMQCCDWSDFDKLGRAIEADLAKGRKSADPFGYQAVSESPRNLQICARVYARENFPAQPPLVAPGQHTLGPKIRVGYVSGEFRTQATAILMAGLFEHHDKDRFEITAFDNGENDGSPMRQRLEQAFDAIVDIKPLTDAEAAREVASRQIDILVNLNGYFGQGRQGIFSHRASPLQVNYLGFPGTIGADYMDYILADRVVIPEDSKAYYDEKVVFLPHCYQANDSRRRIAERAFSREELGLPGDAFVFCCFNNSYKITPRLLDSWVRILRQVDGSVLWLLEDNPEATANLRREAARRGLDPQRLVFGKRLPVEEHLARHRQADLFLDSLPYNAHTTASDALWAGLPVLTRLGSAFPGRVAASLLQAVGLPELITTSEVDYETLAVALAGDRPRLDGIRQKLAKQRTTMPLFDTARLTRDIEAAYATMVERLRAGLPPDHIYLG